MIVIPVKEGENIERALKKFKRKFEKTGVIKELRSRQAYTKPSIQKRFEKQRAIYVQKIQQEEEQIYSLHIEFRIQVSYSMKPFFLIFVI